MENRLPRLNRAATLLCDRYDPSASETVSEELSLGLRLRGLPSGGCLGRRWKGTERLGSFYENTGQDVQGEQWRRRRGSLSSLQGRCGLNGGDGPQGLSIFGEVAPHCSRGTRRRQRARAAFL